MPIQPGPDKIPQNMIVIITTLENKIAALEKQVKVINTQLEVLSKKVGS